VTTVTLGFRLFFILLQINLFYFSRHSSLPCFACDNLYPPGLRLFFILVANKLQEKQKEFPHSCEEMCSSNLVRFSHNCEDILKIKSKIRNSLTKTAAPRIVLNIDDSPIVPKHTLTHHTRKPVVY
jgi:hypothetical protein